MSENTTERAAQQMTQLARAAMNRGHVEAALDLATRVLAMEPHLRPAMQFDGQRRHRFVSTATALVIDAHLARGDASTAAELADGYWDEDPVDPFVSAARIRAREAVGGCSAGLAAFGLVQTAHAPASVDDPDVPVCLTICRNEMAQLPSFLEHHRRIGVRRFIVVDNGSADGTLDFVRAQPDVDLWQTDMGFRTLAFGANAFTAIARFQLADRWLLLLDADERFVPPTPDQGVRELVASLEADGLEALAGALLDVYDDLPVLSPRGPVPVDLGGAVFFDRAWSHSVERHAGPFGNGIYITGGVRRRVFGPSPVFLLSKVPLVKFTAERLLIGGQHDSNAPSRVRSTAFAAVLHTKFLGPTQRFADEVARGEYPNAASDYAAYADQVGVRPHLSLYDSTESIRYDGPTQLVELGIART